MRRRGFVKALAALPVAPALLAQQANPALTGPAQPAPGIPLNSTQPVPPPARASDELQVLQSSPVDAAGETVLHYFNPEQLSALRKVSDLLAPAMNGTAGALDAKAPEFLDFLIGQSPADRQDLYKAGLDGLNAQAKKRFNTAFGNLDAAQAATLMASLRDPWTYDAPADPVARFLRAAKLDVRTATVNSREYSGATAAGAGRRSGGGGLYWYPLD